MSTSQDRLMELLTDRALVGLGQREQIELAELLVKVQDVDVAAFDRAAASIALASLGRAEAMPQSLADKIEQRALAALDGSSKRPASDFASTKSIDKLAPSYLQTQVDEPLVVDDSFKRTMTMDERPKVSTAPQAFAPRPLPAPAPTPPVAYSNHPVSQPAPQQPAFQPSIRPASANVIPFPTAATAKGPSRAVAIGGWLAAAACLLLAIGAFALRTTTPVATLPPTPTAPPTVTVTPPAPVPTTVASLTPTELRAKLLAAVGTTRMEWTSTKDPLGKSTTGEVLWNKDEQKGVMRFSGLAKNDPSRAQYQLWIFDKARDDKYPVDGGVFDVDSETGDVLVPIKATLAVNAPTLFAVTLEKPGGVVVSKRERLVVLAKPTG